MSQEENTGRVSIPLQRELESLDVNALLLPALRQYQHNDDSGFVAGYDHAETQKIVTELLHKHEKRIKAECVRNLRNAKATGEAFDKLLDVLEAHISI